MLDNAASRPAVGVLRRFPAYVAALMAAAVFGIFIFKIVMRYAFDDPLAWADEVCTILFVWIIFWANAFLVPNRRQIAFDLVVRALPPPWQRAAAILRNLIVGGLFAAALPAATSYLLSLSRQRTPVLQIRLEWVYGCFGIFLAAAVIRAAADIVAALRRT